MTIKELIQDNQHIGDIEIEVRKNGYLIDEWHIGYSCFARRYINAWDKYDKVVGGIELSDYKKRKDAEWKEKHKLVARFPHFVDKLINSKDKGREYYQTLVNEVPKEAQDMEVYSWHSRSAFRGIGERLELEKIYITVEIGSKELPKVKEEPDAKPKSETDFEQLSLF